MIDYKFFIFITLVVLLVSSNLFWAIVCHRLINKLMCNNFGEYIQSKSLLKKEAKIKDPVPEDPVLIKQEERRAEELNTLMGIT